MIPVCKLYQPFDELRATAGKLGAVVEIDHQLANVPIMLTPILPPLFQTIGNKVTRLARRSKTDCQQPADDF